MIEAAEGPRVIARLGMGRSESMLRRATVEISSMKPAAAIESASSAIEVFAIREDSAVRYEPMVVE